VILAAGAGSRLGGLTKTVPKPLVPVAGLPLLDRTLRELAHVGVRDVVLVVGHLAERIEEALGARRHGIRITYVVSDLYATASDIHSAWLAREHLDHDLYFIEGDIAFTSELPARLAAAGESAVAVTDYDPDLRNMIALLDHDRRVLSMLGEYDNDFSGGQPATTISVYSLRRPLLEPFAAELDRFIHEGRYDAGFEDALSATIARGHTLLAVGCGDLTWQEIDDLDDRLIADYRFAPPGDRGRLVASDRGGPWRRLLTDHSYARNTEFPSPEVVEHLSRDLFESMTQRPAGPRTLSELAASAAGEAPEAIAVGAGRADVLVAAAAVRPGAVLGPAWLHQDLAETLTHRLEDASTGLERLEEPEDVDRIVALTARIAPSIFVLEAVAANHVFAARLAAVHELAERLLVEGTLLVLDVTFVPFTDANDRDELGALLDHPNVALLVDVGDRTGFVGIRSTFLVVRDLSLAGAVRERLTPSRVSTAGEALVRLLPRRRAELAQSYRATREAALALARRLRSVPGIALREPVGLTLMCRLEAESDAARLAEALLAKHGIAVEPARAELAAGTPTWVRLVSCGRGRDGGLVEALTDLEGAS